MASTTPATSIAIPNSLIARASGTNRRLRALLAQKIRRMAAFVKNTCTARDAFDSDLIAAAEFFDCHSQ